MKKTSEKTARYDKTHSKGYYIKLNLEYDADIISALDEAKETEGMQTYIKRLIRQDLKRNSGA